MYKKSNILVLLMAIFIISCAGLPVDEINKNVIDSNEKSSKELDAKELDFVGDGPKVIKISTEEEIIKFSKNSNYDFFLKAGDKINVKSSGIIEDSEVLTVRPDGKINVKLIGTIIVENKTPEDIENILNVEIKKYYTNTNYSVEILEYKNNKVYIWGEIRTPGVYSFEGKTSLVEALSKAGGINLSKIDSETKQIKAVITYCCIVRKNAAPLWIKLNSIISEGKTINNIGLLPDDILYIYTRTM